LRFHFAAYDPSMSDAGVAATNQQTTLVFVPTTLEGTNNVSKAFTMGDAGAIAYNEGKVCPPDCGADE
jgi:hypothetical protein